MLNNICIIIHLNIARLPITIYTVLALFQRWVKSSIKGSKIKLFSTENHSTYAHQDTEELAKAWLSKKRPLKMVTPTVELLKRRLKKVDISGK